MSPPLQINISNQSITSDTQDKYCSPTPFMREQVRRLQQAWLHLFCPSPHPAWPRAPAYSQGHRHRSYPSQEILRLLYTYFPQFPPFQHSFSPSVLSFWLPPDALYPPMCVSVHISNCLHRHNCTDWLIILL